MTRLGLIEQRFMRRVASRAISRLSVPNDRPSRARMVAIAFMTLAGAAVVAMEMWGAW